MFKAKLCLIAENVIRDADTNYLSIYKIIEGITAIAFPAIIQQVSFLVIWEREEIDSSTTHGFFALKIVDDTVLTQRVEIDFLDKMIHRSIVKVNGIVLPKPGKLDFELRLSDGTVANYSINIDINTEIKSTIEKQLEK